MERLERTDDLNAIVDTVARTGKASLAAGYLSDAAHHAVHVGPATASYIASMLASSSGGGLAGFEAERRWQAAWLAERMPLGDA
jgi:hypothetical protein